MQCIGYMVLAVYLDKVFPDRMGVRLPFWYPLLPSYWKPTMVITFPFDGHCLFSQVLQTSQLIWPRCISEIV